MNLEKIKNSIDGILLLNKTQGMSSNAALQKAKRLFGAQKAGHSGSLDPLATGMLPVCFGEATKVCQYLLAADKCYETTGLLGIKTNTADATGEVTSTVENYTISKEQLVASLEPFKGNIKQVPSMFSALKHQGTPLYKLARRGIEIEREARDLLISTLQLDMFDGQYFSLTVVCSKGTYIRNLVEDIGDSLNVGAHVTRLHRLYTSGFDNARMYTLDELQEMTVEQRTDCLIPMDEAIKNLSSIILLDEEVLVIRQGRLINGKTTKDSTNCIRLYNERRQFIGLGEKQINGELKAKRLLAFISTTKNIESIV